MYKIVEKMKYLSVLSIGITIASIILWFAWGLNLGIDFTGGTSMQIRFPNPESRPPVEDVQNTLQSIGITDTRIQTVDDTGMVLKMQHISNDQRQQIIDRYTEKGIAEESFSSVGPTLGAELQRKATLAVILVVLAIVVYISYVFRGISKGPVPSWVFGLGAIISLIHDIVLVVGITIILGKFVGLQVDSLFVTALLTVLGFSVHDTIVVFDRIRERLKEYPKKSFTTIINESINSTLARSLNTSITALIVLTCLYFFGGQAIQHFVLILIIGIITGTYSSIFIASPALLLGQRLLKRT